MPVKSIPPGFSISSCEQQLSALPLAQLPAALGDA